MIVNNIFSNPIQINDGKATTRSKQSIAEPVFIPQYLLTIFAKIVLPAIVPSPFMMMPIAIPIKTPPMIAATNGSCKLNCKGLVTRSQNEMLTIAKTVYKTVCLGKSFHPTKSKIPFKTKLVKLGGIFNH